MTPLKKPITVTIETAEELLSLWHRTNAGTGNLEAYLKQYPTTHVDLMYQVAQPLWKKVDLLCKDAAIDPLKWNPPAPLLVAGHEPTFNPDGSIKVGCQTIPKETMELVVKRWQEAGKVEDVWPKFCCMGNSIKTVMEFHQDHSKSVYHYGDGYKAPIAIYDNYEAAIKDGWAPITATYAEEILSNQSLTLPE